MLHIWWPGDILTCHRDKMMAFGRSWHGSPARKFVKLSEWPFGWESHILLISVAYLRQLMLISNCRRLNLQLLASSSPFAGSGQQIKQCVGNFKGVEDLAQQPNESARETWIVTLTVHSFFRRDIVRFAWGTLWLTGVHTQIYIHINP